MKKQEQGTFSGAFLVIFAIALVAGLLLVGCSGNQATSPTQYNDPTPGEAVDATATAAPTGITLNKESITIAVQYQLKATVEPTGSDQAVTWTSSDDKIATVDDTGLVKAVKKGETEIIATSNADPAVMRGCVVKVEPVPSTKETAHPKLDDDRPTLKQCLECH